MIAVASLVAVLWTESFHATRWIDVAVKPSNGTGDDKQISMEAAIQRWKAANNCTDKDCPRPILIAGAGGASRAGFYTATVVGALMDLSRDPENAKIYGDIRSRFSPCRRFPGALPVRPSFARPCSTRPTAARPKRRRA